MKIMCWRDSEKICDWKCPAHSHFGGWKLFEPFKDLKVSRGQCKIIKALETGENIPELIKQELSRK